MFANALSLTNEKRYAQILTSRTSFLKERVSKLLKSVTHVCTVSHRFEDSVVRSVVPVSLMQGCSDIEITYLIRRLS